MKKTLVAILALGGMAMADSDLTFLGTISLSEGVLTSGVEQTTVNVNGADFQSAFGLTISTTNGTLSSGTTGYTLSDADTSTLNDNVNAASGFIYNIANTQSTWVSGAKTGGTDLILSITGLEANAKYNVSLLSGLTFEGPGAWNDLTTENAYGSVVLGTLGEQKIPVKAMGAWAITDVVADANGVITFTNHARGSHTPVFNGVSVAKVLPEPATATLSLLALAGLAARRRRH